jgi:hypothetical protein
MKREGRITGIYSIFDARGRGELLKGTGKTITGMYYLRRDFENGYRALSNQETTFSESISTREVWDIFKDTEQKNLSIFLDEIQKDISSMPGVTDTKLIHAFCDIISAQTRKRNINLYYATQRLRAVHIRLIHQTDYLLQVQRVHSDTSRCREPSCIKEHFIYVYSRDPHRDKPITILVPENIGKFFNTDAVLTDNMGDG